MSSQREIENADLDRLRLALAGIDPDSQIAEWWRELRELHQADGMAPGGALKVSYRQARVAGLMAEGFNKDEMPGSWRQEIMLRVGCSERTLRDDVATLKRLVRPRVTFVEEREAA